MVVTTLHLLYEITFAPATGPYARTTLPTTPLEVNATVKSSPASSSATRKATVGPDPETNAPRAPYSCQHLEQDEVLDAMNMLLVANHLSDEHPLILHQLQVTPASALH